MKRFELTSSDHALIAAAVEAVKKPVRQLLGETSPALVGAAVCLDDGQVITAVNLIADVGSLSVCAEPIAIAEAVQQPSKKIETIVAVYAAPALVPKVVSPCGRCRENITDYAADCFVILRDPGSDALFKVRASDALPFRYAEYWKNGQLI